MESKTEERKEEETEKEAEWVSKKRESCCKNTYSYNQESKRDCKRMDKLLQNRDDETVHGRIWGMVETQNQGHSDETMEKAENNLSKSMLFKLEE